MGLGRDNEMGVLRFFSNVAKNRWRGTDTLIIDEISMMSADLFSKIDYLAKSARTRTWRRPFGGIQVRCRRRGCRLPCRSVPFSRPSPAPAPTRALIHLHRATHHVAQLIVCGDFYQLAPVPSQVACPNCNHYNSPLAR